MLLTFNLQQNNISELSKKFSLLSNQNHLKILLNLEKQKSVKQIHALDLFNNYASTYKALMKLVNHNIIKKDIGSDKKGHVYSLS